MGFCDIVAPITGKIAEQYADHATLVGFLPSMVFLWLFLISTPLASLANRYGRKSVALAGYAFTVAGLAIPLIAGRGCGLEYYFAAFALLGIGNTAVQVAVNPMLAMIVPASRMTSFLTVGQICRNISIMLVGPLVLLLGADWPLLFAIYAALTVLGGIAMWRFAARRQSGRRGAQRHYGRLLPAAGQPHRGHVRRRARRNHSMRRSRRHAVVDTDRQRQLDPLPRPAFTPAASSARSSEPWCWHATPK